MFSNVSYDENDPHGWRRTLEGLYLEGFFLALSRLAPEWFVAHRFVIYKNNTIIHRPNPPAGDERTILLWLSDEGASVPTDICGRYKRHGDHTHSSLPGILHFLERYGMKFSGVFETCHFANGRCEYTNALFTKISWNETH